MHNRVSLYVALLCLSSVAPRAQGPAFDTFFTEKTMRVDLAHTGGPRSGETVALDRVVADGLWPGSRTRLLDDTNLGKYLFLVIDRASNRAIYSRGYSSIYEEWETTAEVRERHRTFRESLRFPWPKQPVQIVLKKRQADNSFREVWSDVIDPGSRFVNRADASPAGELWSVFEHGPAAEKVDVLVMGEGYTAAARSKFRGDVTRLVDALFALEPFKSRKRDFNVRALHVPSAVSGVNRPHVGQFRRTPIAAEFNIFDSERYVLTLDDPALRDAAAAAPYEFLEVLVNEAQYGGGGIFNAHATASVDSAFSDYVFIHEFGHHFAGLADEYYTSDVAYEAATARVEPWEPNVTALLDPAAVKWRDLVEPATPLPTPWDKEAFEKQSRAVQARRRELRASGAPESAMDALFREQQAAEGKLLRSMKYSGKVGAFEGARYEAKGYYRPEADCIMFTRTREGFCRVCQRGIARVIDLYARP